MSIANEQINFSTLAINVLSLNKIHIVPCHSKHRKHHDFSNL
jgi:hypothetical protein